MDIIGILRDPIWQFVGVVVAIILFAIPSIVRWRKQKQGAPKTPPRILVIQSRPKFLYEMLGVDPTKFTKTKRPTGIIEHKPEVVTEVELDSSIIQRVFDEVGKRAQIRSLNKASKTDLAAALRDEWDIVHFDCVVGSQGQIFLEDGEIDPATLHQLIIDKKIVLLVLMDCDSLKVVSSANSAGVTALIAVTGSLPVLAAEKFCYGLYKGIAFSHPLKRAFSDAKALASVELIRNWDSTLFVLDGNGDLVFN